jgi:signal transduction protein with GAF and PtsI domain
MAAQAQTREATMYSDYSDINLARNHQASLKDLVRRHPGNGADWRALRRVLALCKAATDAIDDNYCREKLNLVGEYAGELLSHGEHRRWGCDSESGADFLKRQILNALDLYSSRLYNIEASRRPLAPLSKPLFARLRETAPAR